MSASALAPGHRRNSSESALSLLTTDQRRTKPKSQTAFEFAISLLQVFGAHYAAHIRQNIGKLSTVFDAVHRSFYEIQQQVADGSPAYVSHKFPRTHVLVDKFTSTSCSELQAFKMLKRRSYEMLPFHQRMLTYKACETEYFEAIEADRKHAFELLMDALRLEQGEEKRGGSEAETVNAKNELLLTSLYFNGGALLYEGKIVYFSELIDMWAGFSEENRLRKEATLRTLSARKWVPQVKKPIIAFLKHSRVQSFREFLILCSIEAMQKNLGFQFPELLVNILIKLFQHEDIRSDLCYFTANLRLFYSLDVNQFNRRSVRYLEILQLFLFVIRTQGVRGEYWGSLLIMMMNRSQWKAHVIDGFITRQWGNCAQENQEFTVAFVGIQRLMTAITGRQVDLAHPVAEDAQFLEDTYTSDTLYFFWKNPRRVVFIDNLETLANDPRFNLSFSTMYEFCTTNAVCIRTELCSHFVEKYLEILQKFTDEDLQVTDAQHLFMAPSMGAEVSSNHALRFGNGPAQAAFFINAMKKYQRPIDRDLLKMLREWILRPKPFLFRLLECAQNVGVRSLDRKFFNSVMKQDQDPLGGVLTEEANAQAVQIARKIQEAYQFSDVEIFYLYMEVVRLVLKNQVPQIGQMAQLIRSLIIFCPSFHRQDAYFLFQYHPNVAPEEVEVWVKLRISWAKDDAMLSRFVLPQSHIDKVIQLARGFSEKLSSTCPREEFRGTFESRCTQALTSAFYPPVQPLTDSFRIHAVTPEGGVVWENVPMRTHEGQLKQMSHSSTSIYFNWSVQGGCPVFFLSFFDMQRKEAFSASIPLQVPLQQLSSEGKLNAFWGFLRHLSRQVLREEPDKSMDMEDEETIDTCAACFRGASEIVQQAEVSSKEGNITQPQITAVWNFLKKLKITYRSLYLSCVAERARPAFPSYDPVRVASLGHIYSANPRGSLLPEAMLAVQPHVEPFIVDATVEFVDGCRALFSESKEAFQPLNLTLHLPAQELAVTYLVESVANRKGIEEQQVKEMQEKEELPEFRSRYVVLCQPNLNVKMMLKYPYYVLDDRDAFRIYFDFHNLMFKARVLRQILPG